VPRLSHSEVLLSAAVRDLQRGWQETSSSWRDRARAEFEKEYIDEILPAVKAALGAMNEVNRLLGQAIKECE